MEFSNFQSLNQNQELDRSTMKVGLGKATAIGAVVACYFLPDEYFPGQLKPVGHMFNVVKAGLQMGWVYKFSKKQMTQKHIQASKYLREALRQSGGIYIKLGQLIASLDVIVPDEYRDSMLELTRNCEKSTYENIKAVIQGETGRPISQTFIQFDREPISSASIGQVHRAKLVTGQEVAVKVQHQNLAENVQYDLKLMRAFVSAAKLVFKDDFKYEWLLQQFEVNIRRQLDFRLQAINMERVNEMLKKQKFYNVQVTKLLKAPTKKMLVMEYIHGCHVDQIQKMKAMNIDMKQMGKTFSKVIIKMIHKYGFVHADPHSGNILVKKDVSGKDLLVLLDHGLYQELDENTKQQYNWFWLGLILNREDIAVKAAHNLGVSNGLLLCSILTSKTRQQLNSPNRNLYDLNPSKDKQAILIQAQKWRPQIINLLNQIQRQILLLLKVNQFARSIQNMLGGRETGVYEDIARCCVDNLPISIWQKWKYKWQMLWASRRS